MTSAPAPSSGMDAKAPTAATLTRPRRPNVFTLISLVMLAGCVGMIAWLLWQHHRADALLARHAQAVVARVNEQWTAAERAAALDAAHAYNRHLFENGPKAIGEALDPFTGEVASKTDAAYLGVLAMDDAGTMGRIAVPKIGVDLPVMHGTDDAALGRGAGHLYGTSVPAGGDNTHAVLSAHSGQLVESGFLRLGELRAGDYIYIQTMGETLGYLVDGTEVIETTDFSHFTIEAGHDRLTLMTCWPVGINTNRLLVSGHRASIPDVVPELDDAPRGAPISMIEAGVICFGVLLLAVGIAIWLRWRRRVRREKRRDGAAKAQ